MAVAAATTPSSPPTCSRSTTGHKNGGTPLQPVLRLIHCVQKERGASCALVGSLGINRNTCSFRANLRSTRTASNSAISMFYENASNNSSDLRLAAMLQAARQLVDGGMVDENKHLFFHDVVVEYNQFLSNIIQVFFIDEVSKRKRIKQGTVNSTQTQTANESRRNAKVALSLLDLILSFVTLKESLGMERATLSGLMASRVNEQIGDTAHANNTDGARLTHLVNDLVMVVENQHQIMEVLRKQSGLDVFGGTQKEVTDTAEGNNEPLEENYCAILRLVGDCIRPSDAMRSLQNHIRKDFDIDRFQHAMPMDEFWANITLYMDRLHSMELYLLEELDNCEGSFDGFDLLAMHEKWKQHAKGITNRKTQENAKDASMPVSTQDARLDDGKNNVQNQNSLFIPPKSKEDSELEEWEISLYDVEFHKRIGRGSSGTTYLGKYCNQDVAIKVAATSEMGLEGWTAELMSLKKLHHNNVIRFLGSIYNPSPLMYCLVLEYCDGGDLSVALSSITPPQFFTNVSAGVANGIFYLHKMKYMHRDIKPGNVLLSGDPKSGKFVAKLTDFGLAVRVRDASVTNELTAETGTYRYMAPEVIRHERYDYAADVYSFGLLMWEIITREKPFDPQSPIEAAGAVALEGKRPPFPEGIPSNVRTLIEECWTEQPSERMKVEQIIESIGEISGDMTAESWLAAPTGHPVYKQAIAGEEPARTHMNAPPQQKKKSLMQGLFRKK